MAEQPSDISDTAMESPTPIGPPAPATGIGWFEIWIAIASLAAIGAAAIILARGTVPGGLYLPTLALLVCLLAAGYDAATSRIPNPLTYTAILLGLALNALALPLSWAGADTATYWLGAAGPFQALLGFLICAGLGIACLILAGMGGGDMKLLAAMGAMLGYERVLPVLFAALLIAIVYALINLLIAGRLNAALRCVALNLLTLFFQKQPAPSASASGRSIPLAVPLFLALLLYGIMPLEQLFRWIGGG